MCASVRDSLLTRHCHANSNETGGSPRAEGTIDVYLFKRDSNKMPHWTVSEAINPLLTSPVHRISF